MRLGLVQTAAVVLDLVILQSTVFLLGSSRRHRSTSGRVTNTGRALLYLSLLQVEQCSIEFTNTDRVMIWVHKYRQSNTLVFTNTSRTFLQNSQIQVEQCYRNHKYRQNNALELINTSRTLLYSSQIQVEQYSSVHKYKYSNSLGSINISRIIIQGP